jgi:transcriptional regulator with XRE-family HTH domain
MAGPTRIGPTHTEVMKAAAEQDAAYRDELARLRPYEQVARALIRLRMDRELSQTGLARLVGTSHSAISRLESGLHPPNLQTLKKIAAVTGQEVLVTFVEAAESAPPEAHSTRPSSSKKPVSKTAARSRRKRALATA